METVVRTDEDIYQSVLNLLVELRNFTDTISFIEYTGLSERINYWSDIVEENFRYASSNEVHSKKIKYLIKSYCSLEAIADYLALVGKFHGIESKRIIISIKAINRSLAARHPELTKVISIFNTI